MDTELMMIQIEQDMNELAEQYDSAADNERLWAKGAPDEETARMHEAHAQQNTEMAKFYRMLATQSLGLVETFMEEE